MVVADRDGEPAIICPDNVQVKPWFAGNVEPGVFAGVGRQPVAFPFGPRQGSIASRTC